MNACVRDRVLSLLAEITAERLAVPDRERRLFVSDRMSEWRHALYEAYAGDEVRFGLRRTPDSREARNRRILAAIAAGCPAVTVARRENVSVRLVQVIRQRAQVPA